MSTAEDEYIEVRVIIKGANAQDAEVVLKDHIRWGDFLPDKVQSVVKQAGALAYTNLSPRPKVVTLDRTAA